LNPVYLVVRPWNALSVLAAAATSIALLTEAQVKEIILLTIMWAATMLTAVLEHRRAALRTREALTQSLTLQKRNEDLQRANSALERFTSVAAHQMRSPPRTIKGLAMTALEEYGDRLPVEARDLLESIMRRADNLLEVITVLHEMGMRHSASITLRPLEVAKMIPSARGRVGAQWRGEIDCSELPPWLEVVGNDILFVEVLANLIENGWKFNESPVPTVRFSGCVENGFCRLRIADNGIGLSPSTTGLFQLFRRHTDRFPGTGVGLALVHQAVEKMGGKISVVNPRQGEGAAFEIELLAPKSSGKRDVF
jgi:signal transduction histidine kinase